MSAAIAVLIGYLLGSCPFGYWAGRLRGVDLREHGSGNTGGTNAVRVLGARIGIAVIVLDVLKGTAAVLIGAALGGTGTMVLAGAAAVAGHLYPLFLGFRGGKAVATGAGVMLGLAPGIVAAAFVLWLAIALITRYVSVASMTAALAVAVATIATGQPWPVIAFAVGGAAVVVWRHRPNIQRLRAGTEHRVNLRGARS
jgi:glycerol-3-phosphate acyltransferase PlsY